MYYINLNYILISEWFIIKIRKLIKLILIIFTEFFKIHYVSALYKYFSLLQKSKEKILLKQTCHFNISFMSL